ncbi:MAG: hypothetical protein P8M63_03155 [Paracoccaceae bacterium]|nr:hypothetical protein [Paracoccaceae bacterium]
MPVTKIATCCYCGTRAALVLSGRERHELACSNCGAPLHDLKMLPKRADAGAGRTSASTATPARPKPVHRSEPLHKKPRYNKKNNNKKKSLTRWLLEEAKDAIEDIFD